MRNVWHIFREDTANLFRNVMSVIITIGLVVLPSLFAWYNTLACWNVFDNTGNLPIAVASEDEGYMSDLFPVEVNIGDKVVSALRGNDLIKWVITDGEDAVEGAKSGKYYASLVIPKDFSRQMLTFYENDAQSVGIQYYVNEKKNAIAPNITGAGADGVSYQVNAAFVDVMAEIVAGLAKSTYELAQEDDVSGRVVVLTGHMRNSATRMSEAADVLGMYSTLAGGTKGLIADSTRLVEAAQIQAKDLVSGADADKQEIRDLAEKLATSLDDLGKSLDSNVVSFEELENKLDTLLGTVSDDVGAVASGLRGKAADVDVRTSDLQQFQATLEQVRDDLRTGIGPSLNLIASGENVEVEVRNEITVAIEQTLLLDRAIANLSKAIGALEQVSSHLNEAADGLETGAPDLKQKVETLRTAIDDAKKDFDDLKVKLDEDLKPNSDKLKSDLAVLSSDLEDAAATLGSVGSDLPAVAAGVQDALDKASGKVDDACDKLRTASQGILDLADKIDAAIAVGDSETLRGLMQSSTEDIASALTAPVQIDRHALFPVNDFGSAMAPLYSTLALFVGSLLIMVAVKPDVLPSTRERLRNPKPRHLYFGRFGVVALLSLMQTTLLGLGNMLFLKTQATDPLLYMICLWVSGLVFAFMIYTMVVAFGNLGKAIAVLLLVVQVTACGGSFPLPILPDFVQALSPWVPATYVVDALRAAMFGVYQNDFWISIGKLVLFTIPFFLLGLALRKPLEGFMHFFVEKVEESKIMG